jgi:hypothetical protein
LSAGAVVAAGVVRLAGATALSVLGAEAGRGALSVAATDDGTAFSTALSLSLFLFLAVAAVAVAFAAVNFLYLSTSSR